MDPMGLYLAVADANSRLTIFGAQGQTVGQSEVPRPLRYLAFVPETPVLIGSADLGLVAAFDLNGVLRWRDGLAAQVGGLAVSGNGEQLVLACFSEGLRVYSLNGKKRGQFPVFDPCRRVALSYDGRRILVGGLSERLLLLDGSGPLLANHTLDQPSTAITLSALGTSAVVALADGRVLGLDLRPP
jgi:hypothetical protein